MMSKHYLFGLHAVHAAINNPLRTIHQLLINDERQDKRLQEIITLAKQKKIPVQAMNNKQLNQQFPDSVHQGVVAQIERIPEYQEKDLPYLIEAQSEKLFILLLDGVTDPHNLGACLRTADAAGVHFVIIPKDNSASMNATVSKVACGATETVPLIRVTNLARTIQMLQQAGIWIYGAAGEATQTIYELDVQGSLGLVLGAEGSGLRRLTREKCDGLFSLPMHGSVSSLNVSVATGISLYEILRRRGGF